MVTKTKTCLFTTLTLLLCVYPQTVASRLPDYNLPVSLIHKLNPKLRLPDALAISHAIAHTRCPIAPIRLLALLSIESSLRLKAVNEQTRDYGLAQINSGSIRRFKLDKQRLMTSHAYSVQAACTILNHHKDIVGRYPEWVGSYRAGTNFKSSRTRQNAKRYVKLIDSTVAKLNE